MATRGTIKVTLEGRGPLTLRDTDYVTSGGEGSIYRAHSTIVKLYSDPAKMARDGMPEKIRLLAQRLRHDCIIAPQGVVNDAGGAPIGYYMPYSDGEPLTRLFVSDFRTRIGFTEKDALTLAAEMRVVVMFAHQQKTLMVDANELNWLVKTGPRPQVLDVDSWALERWPATVIMPSIRDWNAKSFSEMTDWFAWGVVTFQLFTGIHPYKGRLEGYKPGELVKRMQHKASVFDPRSRLPHSARDFSCIPGPLLEWYRTTFQTDERSRPPSPHDTSKPAVAARVLRAVITATGDLVFERIFHRVDHAITQIWPCGVARLESGDAVELDTGKTIGRLSPRGEVIKTPVGCLLADFVSGIPMFTLSNDRGVTPIDFTMTGSHLFRAGNRLFLVTERELLELEPRMLSRPVLTVARRWTVLTNATKWFDGVAVQDVLGATHILLPVGQTGSVQVRVKELDGVTVVSAKAADRFAAFVVLDRNGSYQKIELTFDRAHASYTAWTGGADSPDLNMAILPSGVVATIASDGELTLFVPANGNVNKIRDRGVTTATQLNTWGEKLVYIQDNAVWRIKTSRAP